jgi:ABC-2 type transport system permease protein
MPPLTRKTLRDHRRPLLGWGAGMFALLVAYLSFYPSIEDDPVFYDQVLVAKYPGPLRSLVGMEDTLIGAGFLQMMIYHFIGCLLFVAFAASLGRRVIADAEEDGTLELTAVLPITRRRLLLERFAGVALTVLAFALATLALVLAGNAALDMGADPGRIVAAHTGLYLIGLFFGAFALAVGAATGSKAAAAYATALYGGGGFLLTTLGAHVAALSWLRPLSPFHYFLEPRPLYEGWPVGSYLVLLAATAVALLVAVPAFDRRDIGV